MARQRRGERVLGPYRHGQQWRVYVVGAGGEKDSVFFPTEEDAKKAIRYLRRELNSGGHKTVQEAQDEYEAYLRDDKGNKPQSVKDTMWRLGAFFPDREMP